MYNTEVPFTGSWTRYTGDHLQEDRWDIPAETESFTNVLLWSNPQTWFHALQSSKLWGCKEGQDGSRGMCASQIDWTFPSTLWETWYVA